MSGDGTELSELVKRLPEVPLSHSGRATLNGFLLAADEERFVLVVGHLRLTLRPADVLDLEPLDTGPGAVTAPPVCVTVTVPLTVLDLSESVPEDVLGVADRPFAVATRPGVPPAGRPSEYLALERAFLEARGIGPSET